MENLCSRCGSKRELEFASDGMQYCSSCLFYGNNAQCYRCRMYVPVTELQNYRGQMYCPYCIQDLRDEETNHDKFSQEKIRIEPVAVVEKCERCGKEVRGKILIWNGKKLCSDCVEDGKKEWQTISASPKGGSNYTPIQNSSEKEADSTLLKKIDTLIGTMKGEKNSKKPSPELVALNKNEIKNEIELESPKKKHNPNFAIPTVMVSKAKPFTEGIIGKKPEIVALKKQTTDREFSVKSEGIMGKSNQKNPKLLKPSKKPKKSD